MVRSGQPGISILHKYDYNDGCLHLRVRVHCISILHKYDYNQRIGYLGERVDCISILHKYDYNLSCSLNMSMMTYFNST